MTLIDIKKALKQEINTTSRYFKLPTLDKLLNILIDTYVHIIQKHKKGISLGLNKPWPNK